MKKMISTIASILFMSCTTVAFAKQEAAPNSIENDYDKYRDVTSVTIDGQFSINERFFITSLYREKEVNEKNLIGTKFVFLFMNRGWKYIDCNSVSILLDNKQFGRDIVWDWDGKVKSRGVTEIISAHLSTSELKEMINSKKIELRVCNDEFEISFSKELVNAFLTGTNL